MNEGENAPRLCSTDISTGESGNLTPDLNLGTYKNQLFLPKKEKTLIKLANLFAQLNNSSMPPVLMEDQQQLQQQQQQQQGKITKSCTLARNLARKPRWWRSDLICPAVA